MTAWSCESLEAIAGLIEARSGLRLKPDASFGHARLLQGKMRELQLTDVGEYRQLLEAQPGQLDDLVDALTIGETFFFRHLEQFELIQNRILPEILAQRGEHHVIRVWSAGCSTGEEPYSLAILLRLAGWKDQFQITATDISRASLEKARLGVYRKWSIREPGAAWALPFLRPSGDLFTLSEAIRASVQFQRLNLATPCYPDPRIGLAQMDLILCRNVMIYFGRETIAQISARFFDTLAPGAFLLTAAADPPIEAYAPFVKEVLDDVIVYRRPAAESKAGTPVGIRKETVLPKVRDHFAARTTEKAALQTATQPPTHPCPPVRNPVLGAVKPESKPFLADLDAETAFARKDYRNAARLTEARVDDEKAAVLHLRSLANLDSQRAEKVSEALLSRHPISAELHYLRAAILMEMGHDDAAEEMLRRFIYLQGQSPLGLFSLAVLRQRRGDRSGARKGYQQACAACRSFPPEAPIPFSPDETVSSLLEAAQTQLRLLDRKPTSSQP